MQDSTLVVTDLDGTFVYDSKIVRPQDVDALDAITQHAAVAMATGRSPKEIQYIEQQVGIRVDYYIAFNGAFVQDKVGNILLDKPMERASVRRLMQLFTKHGIVFDALNGHARLGNFHHEQKETLWGLEFVLFEQPYDCLQDERIYKINIRPRCGEAAHVLRLLDATVPEVQAYEIGANRIEVVRKDVSKANGILACVRDEQRIVAIGDGVNDIEMFALAHTSYCIARAPMHVKQHAQKIVGYFADAIDDFQAMQ
jgi:hypothetical protein